jgi:phosphatidyl-myo-inositol alpha-mannosyltransferase
MWPMRILLVCPYSLKDFGGVAHQSILLTAGLRKAGVDAYLAVPCDDRRPPPAIARWVWNLGRTHMFESNDTISNVQPFGFRISNIVKRVRPDVVHLEEPLAMGANLVHFLFGSRRRPTIGTFHRADADWLYRSEGRLLRLLGMGSRRLDDRFAVSYPAVKTATEVLGGTVSDFRIVPPAVAPEWFGVPRQPANDGTFTVIYWGRIEPRKGVKHLLDALKMKEVPPWVRLVIVGGGKDEFVEALKRSVALDVSSGRIQFLGPLDDARLRNVVAHADVAVSPAEHGESFRSVLAEAMAAGLPVIASALHPEGDPLVQAGVNGYLVAPANAHELATAITSCASAPADLVRLRHGARQTVKHLTVERLVADTLPIYQRVLGIGLGASAPGIHGSPS